MKAIKAAKPIGIAVIPLITAGIGWFLDGGTTVGGVIGTVLGCFIQIPLLLKQEADAEKTRALAQSSRDELDAAGRLDFVAVLEEAKR